MPLKGFLLFGLLVLAPNCQARAVENTPVQSARQQSSDTVIFTKAFSGDDYGKYHITVLREALAISREKNNHDVLQAHPFELTQSRQIKLLQDGKADVMWSVTSDDLERSLIPVRFPLLQGSGGQRILTIAPQRQPSLPATMTLERLKQFPSVQGGDWPDYHILSAHKFNVAGAPWSSWYITMYKMVEKDMVTYFPRNIIEVHRDLAHHASLNIVIEQNHLLSYPSYEYFFVNPERPELARRLKKGLLALLASGRLQKLFESIPEHRKAQQLIMEPDRKQHQLTNPILSYEWASPRWSTTPEASHKEFSQRFSQPL
ncbi:hypothetical protein HHX48_09050 [Salinimonas sp. HHU 13199]|uniref:Solute-binding protein family 3/N-terminal domain-containing protein n=1 Tax=Salinimonas profundi TaxID=2729140 RepID=A0ABR8LI01_9ALTE|nr:hypothetical protein [Salinimonas profundi]MBD3585880.1 hypothetical protein [Salinimonas profundi]